LSQISALQLNLNKPVVNNPPDKTASGFNKTACPTECNYSTSWRFYSSGFVGRFIYGGFILNLAAVLCPKRAPKKPGLNF
jgi:hypothetical protein